LEVEDLEKTTLQAADFPDERKGVEAGGTQAFLCMPPDNRLDLTKVGYEQGDYINGDYASVCTWITYYQGPCGGQIVINATKDIYHCKQRARKQPV